VKSSSVIFRHPPISAEPHAVLLGMNDKEVIKGVIGFGSEKKTISSSSIIFVGRSDQK